VQRQDAQNLFHLRQDRVVRSSTALLGADRLQEGKRLLSQSRSIMNRNAKVSGLLDEYGSSGSGVGRASLLLQQNSDGQRRTILLIRSQS